MSDSKTRMAQFNDKSQDTYNKLAGEWQQHQRMLKDMKLDLDYITKKLK